MSLFPPAHFPSLTPLFQIHNDNMTLFIKGLGSRTNLTDLYQMFNPHGSLKEIRLITDKRANLKVNIFSCDLKYEDYFYGFIGMAELF